VSTPPQYRSDRWVTPAVIVTFVCVAGVLVALTIGAVTYLQSVGRDPEPMLKLAGMAVTAVSSTGGFLLQLIANKKTSKVERNTGLLPKAVADEVEDRLASYGDHSGPEVETTLYQRPPPPVPAR
jgi:hypothetical protein